MINLPLVPYVVANCSCGYDLQEGRSCIVQELSPDLRPDDRLHATQHHIGHIERTVAGCWCGSTFVGFPILIPAQMLDLGRKIRRKTEGRTRSGEEEREGIFIGLGLAQGL